MNLAEFRERLETEPLTGPQLGAIMREWRRLGLDGPADRGERLAVTAALAGLDGLASTCELTMGQAGLVLRALRGCAARADLPDPAGRHHAPAALSPWWLPLFIDGWRQVQAARNAPGR